MVQIEALEPTFPCGIGTSLIPRGTKRIPSLFLSLFFCSRCDYSVGVDQTPELIDVTRRFTGTSTPCRSPRC